MPRPRGAPRPGPPRRNGAPRPGPIGGGGGLSMGHMSFPGPWLGGIFSGGGPNSCDCGSMPRKSPSTCSEPRFKFTPGGGGATFMSIKEGIPLGPPPAGDGPNLSMSGPGGTKCSISGPGGPKCSISGPGGPKCSLSGPGPCSSGYTSGPCGGRCHGGNCCSFSWDGSKGPKGG